MEWYVSLNLFVATQTALLGCILLWTSKQNITANRILSALLFVLAFGALAHANAYGQNPAKNPGVFLLTHINYLLGPLLYLFTRSLTEIHFRMRMNMLLHLLPAALMAAQFWIRLTLKHDEIAATDIWSSGTSVVETGFNTYAHILILVFYSGLSLSKLYTHRREIEAHFSSLENVQLRWLKGFFFGVILLCVFHLLFQLFRYLVDYSFEFRMSISMTSRMLLIYFLVFMALRQRMIYIGGAYAQITKPTKQKTKVGAQSPHSNETSAEKYQTSSLSSSEAYAIWHRLCDLMDKEKPYLENELRIIDLANLLDESVDHTSQSINRCGDQNFFQLVNAYRCNEAGKLLVEYPEMPIIQVAEESGYNSQSTFYTQFKAHFGKTPRQYRLDFLEPPAHPDK